MGAIGVLLDLGCNHAKHSYLNCTSNAVPPNESQSSIKRQRMGYSPGTTDAFHRRVNVHIMYNVERSLPNVYAAVLDWRSVALHVHALTLYMG